MRRDLLITNATLVDVVTGTAYQGWFTVVDGRFCEVEAGTPGQNHLEGLEITRRLDLGGAWVQPGMLDAHMHIESSLVTPRRFAEAVLPRGTTTILQDPHEVANVLGAPGIRWMIEASHGLPLRVYTAISSCVPATSPEIETPNASITPQEVADLAQVPEVIALGEVMDFQGLVKNEPHLLAIVGAAAAAGLSLEGHVPSLSGVELSRYIAHGIRSDHTLATPDKLLEQLRKGMWVMIQEKSLTPEVVDTITTLQDRSRVMLVTDDVMPNRLPEGHLDRLVLLAVELGWDPIDAIASATLRPATYLGLRDLGLIAPSAKADFLVCDALAAYPPRQVYVEGRLVVEDGGLVVASQPEVPPELPMELQTVFTTGQFDADLFKFAGGTAGAELLSLRARVIVVNQLNSFTTLEEREVALSGGVPTDADTVLATVIPRMALRPEAERYTPVVCLVAGLGLNRGAFATTFAHDSHNLFVLGRDPTAMYKAMRAVLEVGGGMAFTSNTQQTPTLLPLPLAGLLSDEPVTEVGAVFDRLERELRTSGVSVKNPILLLTLLPLSVSPDFKVTDKGIVDVQARRILAPLVAA